jgi:hypothetical protein
MHASRSAPFRPLRATASATGFGPPPTDPYLATLVALWPDLSEAIRDGTMATLRGSSVMGCPPFRWRTSSPHRCARSRLEAVLDSASAEDKNVRHPSLSRP